MIDLFGLAGLIVGLLFVSLLIISLTLQIVRVKKLKVELIQSNLNFMTVVEKFVKLSEQTDGKSIEQTDGFVKFISESRDWAFDYIENVQSAIEEYRVIADVTPVSKDITVEQAKELSRTYDNLMSFLPEENLL
jgi:hypothetical protein